MSAEGGEEVGKKGSVGRHGDERRYGDIVRSSGSEARTSSVARVWYDGESSL